MDVLDRFLPDGTPGPATEELVAIMQQAGAAIEAVQAARSDDGVDVERKGDGSPVTAADLASNQVLMEGLARIDPGGAIISEEEYHEGDEVPAAAWVIDPLDGTKEFIAKRPEYVVNVGYRIDAADGAGGRAVFGAVYVPATGESFVGAGGIGAWSRKDGEREWNPIRVAPARSDAPLRVVMSRSHRGEHLDAFIAKLDSTGRPIESVSMGSAWKLLLVASGKADLYPRLGPTMWWDTLAPHAIVEGAGGTVTDVTGKPFTYDIGGAGADERPLLNPWFVVHAGADRSVAQALVQIEEQS